MKIIWLIPERFVIWVDFLFLLRKREPRGHIGNSINNWNNTTTQGYRKHTWREKEVQRGEYTIRIIVSFYNSWSWVMIRTNNQRETEGRIQSQVVRDIEDLGWFLFVIELFKSKHPAPIKKLAFSLRSATFLLMKCTVCNIKKDCLALFSRGYNNLLLKKITKSVSLKLRKTNIYVCFCFYCFIAFRILSHNYVNFCCLKYMFNYIIFS